MGHRVQLPLQTADLVAGFMVWVILSTLLDVYKRQLMASRRYRDVELAFYVNERSDVVEKQFSAVTFILDDGSAYLSFRGTDGSFAGWKEDFNLCFKEVIPSQSAAAAYLSGVASATSGALRVGGHSKGGNLAEYAALVTDGSVYDRLAGVYNHDGPSFLGDPSPRIDEPRFQGLLDKTVPESSAFGMILERRADYRVVKSTAVSVFQHEPFSWLVEDGDFVCQEALNRSARFFDDTLDAWLRSRTPAERERFIETVYELFTSTEAGSWGEFREKLLANTRRMIDSGSRLDPDTRKFLLQTLGGLVAILKEETVKAIRPAPRNWLPRRREGDVYKRQELAREAGTAKAGNVVLLGALSTALGFAPEVWEEVIVRRVPPKTVEANLAAFRAGAAFASGQAKEAAR